MGQDIPTYGNPRLSRFLRRRSCAREPNPTAGRTSISAILSRALSGGQLNDYLLSGILGIVEGLTEFLPVSSTAHLRISEALLHISLADGYWKMYTIVIQLGAILCLPVYFRQRIAKFLSTFPERRERQSHGADSPPGPDRGCLCHHRHSRLPDDENHRQTFGEPHHHGRGPGCGRRRHVDRRCHERALRGGWSQCFARPHSHLEDGGHESWPGHLDRRLPNSLRGLSRARRGPCRPSPPDNWRACRGLRRSSFPSSSRFRRWLLPPDTIC